jgi:cobalt/nickel transport system permease protein
MAGLCNHALGSIGLAGDPASPIHRLDARAKIVGLLAVTVIAVSTPLRLWPVYVGCAAVLLLVAIVGRISPRDIWRRSRLVLPLILFVAIFLPFFRKGGATYELGPMSVSEDGLKTFAEVSIKATIGTVSAVLLGATTTFPAVLHGLEAMRVPKLFVLIAGFMYRYLFVVVDEALRMRSALTARAYRPRHLLQSTAIGKVVSSLFLRSYTRGERVYLSMLARGYRGSMPVAVPPAFHAADTAFLCAIVGALVGLRVAFGVTG